MAARVTEFSGAQRSSRRWIRSLARLWSAISLALIAAFFVGEGFHPSQLSPSQVLGFLLFPVGVSLGMVLAWWNERLGGTLTVASLVAFYIVHLATSGKLPNGWAWLVFSFPGVLFLVSWHSSRKNDDPAS